MLKLLPVIIGCIGIMATSAMAENSIKTQDQKASYVIGVEVAKQLLVSKDEMDLDVMMLGMKDLFENREPRLTNEEMRNAMEHYQKNKIAKESSMREKFIKKNKIESDKYLAKNGKKKGVVTLASGLQYKVIKSGKGKVSPKLTDTVETHYHGTLIDGTVFDSSVQRGKTASFPVNRVIKGWTEALQKMKVGDKWQLVIPSNLAYGERGSAPKIAPGATLLFDIELLSIK